MLILDQDVEPVGSATVTAVWAFNGVFLGEASSTTDGAGVAVLSSPKVKAKSGDVFTIEITGVAKEGNTYDPVENNVDTTISGPVP